MLIVREQHALNNYKWIKSVNKNFNGIRKVVNDVTKFNRQITNPRTWTLVEVRNFGHVTFG